MPWLAVTSRKPAMAREIEDPWGTARSLEWATTCPPPRHNFNHLPRIRSESPAFDVHHPEIGAYNRRATHGTSGPHALLGEAERGGADEHRDGGPPHATLP